MPHSRHNCTNTLYDYAIINPLTPNDLYMSRRPTYESYRTANLRTLHFIYLFNKCRY